MSSTVSGPLPDELTRMSSGFRKAGIVFALLGVLAVIAPVFATLVIEQFIAWILIIWGIAGIVFARSFNTLSEWRVLAVGFLAVLVAGVAFVILPGAGITALTVALLLAFFLEGGLSIMIGLRLSGQIPNWRWIVFSGGVAFALGLIVLFQWSETSNWLLGFWVGLNFLSTGLSLFFLSRVPTTSHL